MKLTVVLAYCTPFLASRAVACIPEASTENESNACSSWLPDRMCCEGLSCQSLMGCYPNPRQAGDPCSLSRPCRSDRCCGPGLICVESAIITLNNVGICTPGSTIAPTMQASESPSLRPTYNPTSAPTLSPTPQPSHSPTKSPTTPPTSQPTLNPTHSPTLFPTLSPTSPPSATPTPGPTPAPTPEPTATPTVSPTSSPTPIPTVSPTSSPTARPTDIPTKVPTGKPTMTPTSSPTPRPSLGPTLPVINLAINKAASQSSTCNGGDAGRANDGNTFPFFQFGSSVSSTCNEANPWWQVELGSDSTVQQVVIHNRVDCCSEFLSNAVVEVLGDEGEIVATRAIGDARNVLRIAFDFGGVQGAAVRIRKETAGVITLAEVEVMGQASSQSPVATPRPSDLPSTKIPAATPEPSPRPTNIPTKAPTKGPTSSPNSPATPQPSPSPVAPAINLALNKPASQSSTCEGGDAGRANDGNTFPFFQFNSVTHTCNDANPWWQVALDSGSIVQKVIVYNRVDCCSERLSNSQVEVLDETGEVLASRVISNANRLISIAFNFDDVQGVAVRIRKTSGVLSLAEVEVMGISPTPSLRGGDGSRDGGVD